MLVNLGVPTDARYTACVAGDVGCVNDVYTTSSYMLKSVWLAAMMASASLWVCRCTYILPLRRGFAFPFFDLLGVILLCVAIRHRALVSRMLGE